MTDFRTIFEQAYPGKDSIYEKIILPIFKNATDLRKTPAIALAEADTKIILQALVIAQVTGTFPITFADVTVQSSVHLKRSRVSIQNCIRAIMEDNTSALIFFHFADNQNEWRVSFVHRAETLRTSTSAKRYTYLCGTEHPCRTIAERFQQLAKKADDSDITVADMLDAFSVEALSKEFYQALFKWYEWAATLVTFPTGDTTRDGNGQFNVKQSKDKNEKNLIRLITRLMFVWFIKQKNLIPAWIFNINELQKVLTDFMPNSKESGNYYNAILQNLFFATLNKKIEDRAFADDTKKAYNTQFGVKIFYRDNRKVSFFKESKEKIIERFKAVPFLNGGLFECLDELKDSETKTKNIEVFIDGFSREPEWMAFIPNQLFWQNDKDHEGLIHLFNRYNFTVEENTPNDMQVALDPELLGKVFENLLGTYNTETRETARKASGSFYTPRKIVNFMVDESLKHYLLQTVTGITDEQIDRLFNDEIEHYDYANQDSIVQAIKAVKILDPACGSGAFPMCALGRMVHIIKKCNGVEETPDAIYQLKLTLIEQCLYGIDIQTIAVQICKLRFFISLICEQERNNSAEDNYGMHQLPNLETKFVAADTLIGLKKEDTQVLNIVNDSLSQLKDELAYIRAQHFKVSTAKEKYEYREQDRQKRQEIIDMLETQCLTVNPLLVQTLERDIKIIDAKIKELPVVMVDAQVEQSLFDSAPTTLFQKDKNEEERENLKKQLKDKRKQLADAKTKKSLDKSTDHDLRERAAWNPYNQNAVGSFFDADWMFNVKDGFDIVIGNPPYIQLQDNNGELAQKYEMLYFSAFAKTGDIYCLFYEKGLSLLKPSAHLCFITSNKWMRAGYGEKLRQFLSTNACPKLLIDLAGEKIFENVTVDVNILLLQKAAYTQSTCALRGGLDCLENRSDLNDQESGAVNIIFPHNSSWVILSPIEQRIKEKIEKVGVPLKDWDIQINYGIKTGCNEAFIIDKAKKDELIALSPNSVDIIRPILRGRDIKRYGYDFADTYLLNVHNGIREKGIPPINIDDYPAVKAHLDQYWDKISVRDDRGKTPYNLRNCAYMDDFNKQKIIYPNMTKYLPFLFDDKNFFVNQKCFIITGQYIGFLTAFFNSSLFKYCFRDNFPELRGGTRELSKIFFETIPVIAIDAKIEINFLNAVKDIQNNYTHSKAFSLDEMIFKLYKLSREEETEILNKVNNYYISI